MLKNSYSNALEKPEPETNEAGFRIITEDYCKKLCEYNGGYEYPHLNANLYLHFQGFHKIENLERFTNLKVLYLENNSLKKIEGLSHLKYLTCLYLQNNFIEEIEGLENNTNIVILNLSNNRIKRIENLSKLLKLENLYIEKNYLSTVDHLRGLLETKKLTLLDIQSNEIDNNPDGLLNLLEKLENLKVLYLKGNEVCRQIVNYRRAIIVKLKHLTYLDDRPVREEDRIGATAYLEGGYAAEQKAREQYRNATDKSTKTKKKVISKEDLEEKRKKYLENLAFEYEKRRNIFEQKKKELIKEYESKPEKREELNVQLSSLDFQIQENEELKKDEEKNIEATLRKKNATADGEFIYENWMDDVLELHVLENCFDFERALTFIYSDFRRKNVKNYQAFKLIDLRSKWTELELKKYRKDDNNCYHFRKEDVFPEEKENKKEIEKEKEKVNKTEEIIEEVTVNKNGDSEEKGFKITILEGNIEDNDINTSSKNKEQRLDDLD